MRALFYTATRPGLPGIYNRLVRLVDRSPWSHCELQFSDGVCASASWMDGGVRFKTMDPDPAKWLIVDLGDRFDEASARDWFRRNEGLPYDLGGNLKFVWHWWPQSDSRWFCTEAIAAALGLPGKACWYGPRKLAEALGVGP